jgi:hypothetical protein
MKPWIICNLGTDENPEYGISTDGQSYIVPDSWIDFLSWVELGGENEPLSNLR